MALAPKPIAILMIRTGNKQVNLKIFPIVFYVSLQPLWRLVIKESVRLISLSERRLWNDLNTNKQYPTPVLSAGHRVLQAIQYEVTSVLLSLCSENFHIFVQG